MPVDYRAPNINARRLGLYLRQLREILELSYDAAATRLGCAVDWLVRVETGFEPVSPDQVRSLLDRYEVPPHRMRGVLIDLASRPSGPPWLAEHAGRLKALVRDLITIESESPLIHTFGIGLVPELVRTEAYARAYFAVQIPEVDVDLEWRLLESRQRHRPGGHRRVLDVIVDENTLTAPLGSPEIVRGQLGRLLDLADDGRSTVRVIPIGVGAHAGLDGSFDVLEFPELDDHVSLVHGALGIDLAQVDLSRAWQLIENVALPPADSRDLITQLMNALPGSADPVADGPAR